MSAIEDKVERLESILGQFIVHTDVILRRLENAHKEMNRQWAALAKKMGTLDEDLIAPATRSVLSKYFKCEPSYRGIRILKRVNGEDYEVDVLVVCEDKVFMIEVRSTPKVEYVDEIIEKAAHFKRFFPEYADKELILIYGSIVFPENVINYASKKGLYLMAYREWEYMDIINFDEVMRSGL
ncbi:MAG: hypothetical protein AB1480_14115 [Nitrospirota bacterium]